MLSAMRLVAALTFATVPLAAHAAPERTATDSVFEDGMLTDLSPDVEVVFSHERGGAPIVRPLALSDATVMLRTAEDGVSVVLAQNGGKRTLDAFPRDGGNPILLVFLESMSRAVAKAAGGSVFYIRNRMKDAFREGGALSAGEAVVKGSMVDVEIATFQPFENDPASRRMRGFETLELRFVRSDAVPGGFLSLQAEALADDGSLLFRETMTYDPTGSGGR